MSTRGINKTTSAKPSLIERLRTVPRYPGPVWRWARGGVGVLLQLWMRVYHRFTIVGRENLPKEGSYILVANHSSHMDTLALIATVPFRQLHRTYPAAAADYFFASRFRTVFMAFLLNAVPFQRRQHMRRSLALCRKLLAESGNVLILYPEGTRSTDGQIREFRPGVGLVLGGTTVAGVPCYLEGSATVLPKGAWFPRPRRMRLVIGKPRTYETTPLDKAGMTAVSSDLEHAVRKLAAAYSKPGIEPESEVSETPAVPVPVEARTPVVTGS